MTLPPNGNRKLQYFHGLLPMPYQHKAFSFQLTKLVEFRLYVRADQKTLNNRQVLRDSKTFVATCRTEEKYHARVAADQRKEKPRRKHSDLRHSSGTARIHGPRGSSRGA